MGSGRRMCLGAKVAPAQTSGSPLQAMTRQDRDNYEKFLKFLHIFFVRAEPVVNLYTIDVSYDSLVRHGDFHLIVAISNSRTSLEDWLLPAARQFLCDEKIGDEDGRTNETCICFSESFPESIYWLKDDMNCLNFVDCLEVFRRQKGRKIYVLAPTARGRLLFVNFMALISENHSQNKSYSGNFSINDILIIKNKNSDNEIMRILKGPIVGVQEIDQATAEDLHRAAEIFMPLYEYSKGVYPVYFEQFKKDLEGATKELVAEEWFLRKYLCCHVAVMPSAARRSFEVSLYSTRENCEEADIMFNTMVENNVKSSDGWNNMVLNSVLHDVYTREEPAASTGHRSAPGPKRSKYGPSLSEFIRFRRNYLVHGGKYLKIEDLDELEMYAANMFGDFLPELVRTLLKQGITTKKLFKSAWSRLNPFRKSEP